MWIKRSEWVQMITSANEHRVRAEMLDGAMKGNEERVLSYKKALNQYAALLRTEKEKNALLSARVTELEAGLVKLQDELNLARKMAIPLQSLNLAEMFDQEDEDKVAEMRKRIKEEGADVVLAKELEK